MSQQREDIAHNEVDLPSFFAWARPLAYAEFERRMSLDATLDPNWTFSDIMQELLHQYRQHHATS